MLMIKYYLSLVFIADSIPSFIISIYINTPMENELFDYITGGQELEKLPYKNKFKEINLQLTMYGFSELGDLFDTSLFSINKTLNVVGAILEDRQKILDSKGELIQKMSKNETDFMSLMEKYETNREKITELTNKNNFLKNKFNVDEKAYKEEIEKLKTENGDLRMSISKLNQKDNQWKHEMKKTDKEIEDLKIKLKKNMSEKESTGASSSGKMMKSSSSSELVMPSMKLNQTLPGVNYQTPSTSINDNLISFENLIKNSNAVLHNVNHLREFYNLIFQAFNEKINYTLNENADLRDCYKIILREINQYVDYKKLILHKFSKDTLLGGKSKGSLPFDTHNNLLNPNLFELDFNDSRDHILNNFNEIINIFRFVLIYDILKIEPTKEFDFEEIKKIVINKKFDYDSLPYYKDIKSIMEKFDVSALKTLKATIENINLPVLPNTNSSTRKKISKDEVFMTSNALSNMNSFQESKSVTILEEINKEFLDTVGFIEGKITNMEKEVEKQKELDKLKESKEKAEAAKNQKMNTNIK